MLAFCLCALYSFLLPVLLVRLSSVLTCFLSSVYLSPQFPSFHCLVIINLLCASRSAHLIHSIIHSLTHSVSVLCSVYLVFVINTVRILHRPASPAFGSSLLSLHTLTWQLPLSCTARNLSCQTVTESKSKNTPSHLKASPNCQIHHLSLSHNHQISLRSFQKVGHIYI